MPKIHLLDIHESQKIAAGEVVDRPANVVKELIENALDAGATHITIFIEDGGKKLIRIIDNGCGMDYEDAHMAFVQHATSKITRVEDLAHIATFGFRGEALASIAAVSSITLTTKEQSAPATSSGLTIVFSAGTKIEERATPANAGTDIAIRDLFFNVPARQKFLKSRDTEWRAILQCIQALCLAYMHAHFMVYHDSALSINAPATDNLAIRCTQIFGAHVGSHMLAIQAQHEQHHLTISGVISDYTHSRYDRNHIFMFVNKRWVKNHKLAQALIKGYNSVLAHDKYPAAALFIEIPQHELDINIHPRKEEIQFLHPRIVETAIQAVVQQRLETVVTDNLGIQHNKPLHTTTPPSMVDHKEVVLNTPSPFAFETHNPATAFATYKSKPPAEHHKEVVLVAPPPATESALQVQTQQRIFTPQQKTTDELSLHAYTLFGQLHATYLLIETEQGLTLIDQHAAQERIFYNLFEQRFKNLDTVPLLFAQTFELTPEDAQLCTHILPLLHEHGIMLEQATLTTFIVQALPIPLKHVVIKDLVLAVIAQTKTIADAHHTLRAQMACKAAIKAGDILSVEQMHELITQLARCPQRLTCPHGRPTTWLLEKDAIERMFKRKL